MAVGPIPWRDIVAYADRLGMQGLMHRTFVTVLMAMDRAYLGEWVPSQRPEVPAPAAPGAARGY